MKYKIFFQQSNAMVLNGKKLAHKSALKILDNVPGKSITFKELKISVKASKVLVYSKN